MTSEESVNAKINAIQPRWLPNESDDFNGLLPHEVDVVLTGAFATEYANGGLMQWFCNGPGEYADVVARVLGEMGAVNVQDVLRRFLGLFPDYNTMNAHERHAALTPDKQTMIYELEKVLRNRSLSLRRLLLPAGHGRRHAAGDVWLSSVLLGLHLHNLPADVACQSCLLRRMAVLERRRWEDGVSVRGHGDAARSIGGLVLG